MLKSINNGYLCHFYITQLLAESFIDHKWNSRPYLNDPLTMASYMKNMQMHPKTSNRLFANNMFSLSSPFYKPYNYHSKFPPVVPRGLQSLTRTYYRKEIPFGSGRPSRSVYHYMYRPPGNKLQMPTALYKGHIPYMYETVEKTPNFYPQMYPVTKNPTVPVPAFTKVKPFTYPILPVINNFTSPRIPHTKSSFGFVPSVKTPFNHLTYQELQRNYKAFKPTANYLLPQKSLLTITPAPIMVTSGSSRPITQLETTVGSVVINNVSSILDAVAEPLRQLFEMASDETINNKQTVNIITSTPKSKIYFDNNQNINWKNKKTPRVYDKINIHYNTSATENRGLFLPTPIATEYPTKGKSETSGRQHSLFTVEDAISIPLFKNNLNVRTNFHEKVKTEENNNKYPFSWSGSASDAIPEYKYSPKSVLSISQDNWYPVSTIVTVQPPKFNGKYKNEEYSVASSENFIQKIPNTSSHNIFESNKTPFIPNDFLRETYEIDTKKSFFDLKTTTPEPELPITSKNPSTIIQTSTSNDFRTSQSARNLRTTPISTISSSTPTTTTTTTTTTTMSTNGFTKNNDDNKNDIISKMTTETVTSTKTYPDEITNKNQDKILSKPDDLLSDRLNIPKKRLKTIIEIKNRFKLRRPKYRSKSQLDNQNDANKETEVSGSTTTEISKDFFENDTNSSVQNLSQKVKPTKSIISKLKQKAATSSLQFLQDRKNLRLNMTNVGKHIGRKRVKTTTTSTPKPTETYHPKLRSKSVSTLSNLILAKDEVTTNSPTVKAKRKEREFTHTRLQISSTQATDVQSSPQPKRNTVESGRIRNTNRGSIKSRQVVDRTKIRTTTTQRPQANSRQSLSRNSRTRNERTNSRRTVLASTTTETMNENLRGTTKLINEHTEQNVIVNHVIKEPTKESLNKVTKNPEAYESAIMKISNFQENIWNKQREQSKRYGRGSSNLGTLGENLQTLELPITISTEVPKLPIEAFFPQIQNDR